MLLVGSWVDSSGNFWLFGGEIYGVYLNGWSGVENDLWMFNPNTSEWTWMGGGSSLPASCTLNNNCGQPGVYGQQRSPSIANLPGAREDATTWTDKSGNLWLFGGDGFDSQSIWGDLNDLWEFTPSSKEWVWISGSSMIGVNYGAQPGQYGTYQVPASGNTPGGRERGIGWTDAEGNLWLFGGFEVDVNASDGVFNDLWVFNPSTMQWAWMSGSTQIDPPGSYGTMGIPSVGNLPPPRQGAAGWTDSKGNLWLFGGENSDLFYEDLWEYQPYSAVGLPATSEPSFSPPAGSYPSVQSVSISDTTTGSAIYYMINGNAPPIPYSSPIAVTSSETIQAIASASGYANSPASTAVYTLNLPPPPTPVFSAPPGTYYGIQTIAITDAESYATIYYTTDGTTPTVSSNVYNGGVQVTTTETIQAIAVVAGGSSSPVASATYTILPVPPNTWTLVRGIHSVSTSKAYTARWGWRSPRISRGAERRRLPGQTPSATSGSSVAQASMRSATRVP